MSKDLLREAVADAKAVKEIAYANAKLALEQAIAPHIQSMISAKLSEDLEEDVTVDETNAIAFEGDEYGTDDMKKVKDITEEKEDETEKDMHETSDITSETTVELSEKMEDDDEDEMDEMTDLELEAIIRELEEALSSSDIGQGDNKQPSTSASAAHTEDPGKNQLVKAEAMGAETEDEKEKNESTRMVDLDELIQALSEIDSDDDGEMDETTHSDEEMKAKMEALQADLDEAYDAIKYLKSQINEVTLLNAKLMYSTKLFKKFDLTESQKSKVIENLDRTKSLREAKLIYTTLAETFVSNTNTKKSTIKEAFASGPIPSTKPNADTSEIIANGSDVAARFKQLAFKGLK
jgi:hypothetical protein